MEKNRLLKFRVFETFTGKMITDNVSCFMSFDDDGSVNSFNGISENPIMQYTGLTDKNGKEIYEGDIVKATGWNPSNYQIEFIEGGFCATNKEVGMPTDINHFYDSTGCAIEIIGNIHENSDLLK